MNDDQRLLLENLARLDSSRMNRRQALRLAAMAAMAVPITAACGGDQRTRQAGPSATPQGARTAPIDADRPENAVYPFDEAEKLFKSLEWPATQVPEPTSKVTVTMAITAGEDSEVRHAQFAKFFTELHPNIEIKREITPFADYLTKYMTQAAGGSLPDLMYCHYSWAQNFIKHGILIPLDDRIAASAGFGRDNDFTQAALSYFTKDGKLYAVPTDSAPKLLWYNKTIFDKAGAKVPDSSWTWERLQTSAKELTQGKGATRTFGFAQFPGDPFTDITPIYLRPFGARFLSEDERTVMIDQAVDVLQPWIDLQLKHNAVLTIADKQALQNVDPFRSGKAALSVNGLWILQAVIAQKNATPYEWGLTDLPEGPEGRFAPVVGSSFGITGKSAHPDAAWIVLNAFLSAAGTRFFMNMPPARLSAFEENLAAIKAPAAATEVAKKAVETYGTADGVLKGPATPKVLTTTLATWDLVRIGTIPLAEGLKKIKEDVTPILSENA
ncbi:ABC transporter substrate-binding protein [Nonomuraea soli]|uniref:Multiple sugar transport system substrate-binding protein n=1 Tax=Nonomuraea soli TaxID=1032476 RepID=A0A7W0HNA5_9ACTN|nr:sugar ABC transporter substrate-binding protein [Nonomuraea soli]MBA2889600.1 multiple sugar transport system substrate-binding protein [Nonomuraea soli]